MPNNSQMEYLVRKAQEKVASKGVPDDPNTVSNTDVMLAGFGWLADQWRQPRPLG